MSVHGAGNLASSPLAAAKNRVQVRQAVARERKRQVHTQKLTARQLFHLVRCIAVLVAAALYMVTSIQAALAVTEVLRGARIADMSFKADECNAIGKWLGSGKIHDSPLVTQLLGNVTTLRADTLYIDLNATSFVECQSQALNKALFANLFNRLGWQSVVRDSAHYYKFMTAIDLILPVVDCSFTATSRGDPTVLRGYYLARNKTNTEEVFLLSTRFSMQDYKVPEQNENGPIGLTMYTFFNDMSTKSVDLYFSGAVGYPFEVDKFDPYQLIKLTDDGYWKMVSVPSNPAVEAPRHILTTKRTGFYVKSATEQANLKHQHWALDREPHVVATQWN